MAVSYNDFNDDSSTMMKLFDAAILLTTFLMQISIFNLDWQPVLVALCGSLSGAVILAYFRRDTRKIEQIFKILCAAIGGLVIGVVLQEYFTITNLKFQAGVFFFSSLFSLVMLRALLSATEQNAAEVARGIVARFLYLERGRPAGRRPVTRSKRRRQIETVEEIKYESKPAVEPDKR